MKTKPKVTKRPKAKITGISITRLYNTGNYTNIKYELHAEVPKGASAKDTFCDLVSIINRLKPITRPSCIDQLERTRKKPASEFSEYEKENLELWSEEFEKFESRKADRDRAVAELDALGGTSERRDAKKTWDDDDTIF